MFKVVKIQCKIPVKNEEYKIQLNVLGGGMKSVIYYRYGRPARENIYPGMQAQWGGSGLKSHLKVTLRTMLVHISKILKQYIFYVLLHTVDLEIS